VYLYLEVFTTPHAKGSVSGFPVRRKSGNVGVVIVHSSKSKTFEKAIRDHLPKDLFILGPVRVELWFFLPKPASVTRAYPSVPPDLDKLERSVLDALKPIWEDDSRAVDTEVYKRYVEDGEDPHVRILVESKPESVLDQERWMREAIRRQRLASVGGLL
jgi:Holliday junction resolvase RusA-like endonuclease